MLGDDYGFVLNEPAPEHTILPSITLTEKEKNIFQFLMEVL